MKLEELKVINLVHNQFEDLELWYPTIRVKEEGITVHIVGEKAKEKYIGKHGLPAVSDLSFSNVNPDDYDGLLIPGGWAPDKLRRSEEVINIVKKMNEQKKPIGTICHAGWVLASAEIVKGRKLTSVPAIKDDLIHAGAEWYDEEVLIDENLVTSRTPADLPKYARSFIYLLKNWAEKK
jgi:protease I